MVSLGTKSSSRPRSDCRSPATSGTASNGCSWVNGSEASGALAVGGNPGVRPVRGSSARRRPGGGGSVDCLSGPRGRQVGTRAPTRGAAIPRGSDGKPLQTASKILGACNAWPSLSTSTFSDCGVRAPFT